jgi:hypothetical protein
MMNWFERITGFRKGPYEETQARLRVEVGDLVNELDGTRHAVGRLELVSLGELRERAAGISLPGRLSLGVVEGDVRQLHAAPENAGATFQVASQFNLLEMIGPEVTPEEGGNRLRP